MAIRVHTTMEKEVFYSYMEDESSMWISGAEVDEKGLPMIFDKELFSHHSEIWDLFIKNEHPDFLVVRENYCGEIRISEEDINFLLLSIKWERIKLSDRGVEDVIRLFYVTKASGNDVLVLWAA